MPKLLIRQLMLSLIILGLLPISADGQTTESPSLSEPVACEMVVDELVDAINECSEINNNWVCYGYRESSAAPRELRFYEPRDRQPITATTSITTTNPTGASLMRLWTSIDPSPLTVMLYGGLDLKPDGLKNTFILRLNSQGAFCENTPPGMIIRTEGTDRTSITVNNVEIKLGSVALITLVTNDLMIVSNLQGRVAVRISESDPFAPVPLTTQVRIRFQNGDPQEISDPEQAVAVNSILLQRIVLGDDGIRNVWDPNTAQIRLDPEILPCGEGIQLGQSLEDESHTGGQECLFTTNDITQTLTVEMDAIGGSGNLDPAVDLWCDNVLIHSNNDIDLDNTNSLICNEPIPVGAEACVIVARSHRNDTFGKFQLTVDGQTTCIPPEPLCEVITPGLNVRSGPGLEFEPIRVVTDTVQLKPLARDTSGGWIEVALVDDLRHFADIDPAALIDNPDIPTGWVSSYKGYLLCDRVPTTINKVEPTPTFTPEPPPPSNGREGDGPDVPGPGGAGDVEPPPPEPKSPPYQGP